MKSALVRTAAIATVLLTALAPTTGSTDSVALQWNEALLQAVRNTRFAPMLTARALAVVHTAMYDAWTAYDPAASSTAPGAQLRRPADERTLANKEQAVSYAAHRTLVDLFPSEQAAVFDPLMADLGYDPLDLSTDLTTPAGIGNEAARNVLEARHHDGSNQLGDVNGGASYSDYTGYVPINTADVLNDPSRWQPLRAPNGSVQVFATPHWGLVTPFALDSVYAMRPKPPSLYPDPQYLAQTEEIRRLSATLTDRTKTIAVYWADGPATETPPGHWSLFAQFVSRRDAHGLDEDVKLFFALGNALLDASIAVWDCKVYFDYVRPVTAVRFLNGGKTIEAWGGPYQGTTQIRGEDFQPYIATPPFAEYTSGHSAFSAAAATILQHFTGSDEFGASVTIAAGSSPVEPGLVPAADVTLQWETFSAAADEAGLSRRLGGIHFRGGDMASRRMGREIGRLVWKKAQAYFAGR